MVSQDRGRRHSQFQTNEKDSVRLLKMRTRFHRLRVAVVRAVLPPLPVLYRAFYHFCIGVICWRLRRILGAKAIYLRRGMARGEVIYGVSDADIGYCGDCQSLPEALRVHRKWARFLPVLDLSNDPWCPEKMLLIYNHHPHLHYRYYEGFLTWKLIWGEDVIRNLPPPSPTMIPWGVLGELGVWWSLFSGKALLKPTTRWEEIESVALCYKAVAETFKLIRFLETGVFEPKRRVSLAKEDHLFGAEGDAFARRLLAHEKARFLQPDPTLSQDTFGFLLWALEAEQIKMRYSDMALPLRPVRLSPDCSLEEWSVVASERSAILEFAETAKREWAGFISAALVPCMLFHVEEPLLILRLNPRVLPERSQLSAFVGRISDWQAQRELRLNVYILLDQAAYSLVSLGMEVRGQCKTILNPALAPDLFRLLESSDYYLLGDPLPANIEPAWTAHNEFYMLHWRHNPKLTSLLELWSPEAMELEAWDFLTRWWRVVQLNVIMREALKNEPLPPLTIPAICRALEREGNPLPMELTPLCDAYRNALLRKEANIDLLRAPALAFLRSLDAETQERFPV